MQWPAFYREDRRPVAIHAARSCSIAGDVSTDVALEQNQGYCSLIQIVKGRRSLLVASTSVHRFRDTSSA